jgi:hypothetical protein
MANLSLPHYALKLPWFMYDIYNFQMITSVTIPGDISDSKDVLLTEVPIPGLNYAPVMPSGNGNRKISFTLPLIKRNNTLGNSLLLRQFDSLRNQATGLLNLFPGQFTPNPKVLYYWGTGSVPLIYFVKKIDFSNKQFFMNELGNPQYSEVSIELWLDEDNLLYKAEQVWRTVASVLQNGENTFDAISKIAGFKQSKIV